MKPAFSGEADRCPRVTVGIPVRNGWASLQRAIAGVLAQSFTDFELIIADNASTEFGPVDLAQIVKSDGRVQYLRHADDIGAAGNFAAVLAAARAPYFMWHAGDDLITPTYLQRCVEVLDTRPDVGMVTCVRTERISRAEIDAGFVGFEEETADERLDAFLSALPDRNARFYSVYRRELIAGVDTAALARFAGDWGVVASILAQAKSVVLSDRSVGYLKSRGGASEDPGYTRRALTFGTVLHSPFAALEERLPAPLRRRRRLKLAWLRVLALRAWLTSPRADRA